MQALVKRETAPGLWLEDVPEPTVAARDVLIKVDRTGICGTDLHAFRGRQPFFDYPRILGHELGVEVTAVGPDVETVKVGDEVTVLGTGGGDEITLAEMAGWQGTGLNDLLMNFDGRLPGQYSGG